MVDSEVSIRSPRRSEGRCDQGLSTLLILDKFQSAPPAEARGDIRSAEMGSVAFGSFNPLPPPKRGEIL